MLDFDWHLYLTLANTKCRGQGHDRQNKYCNCQLIESGMWPFYWHIYI